MNLKALIVSLVLLTLILSSIVAQPPDSSKLEKQTSPKIIQMKADRVLVVKAKGDPNIIGVKAFGLLFKLYFEMKNNQKGYTQMLPKARWPKVIDSPKPKWIGQYALSVSDSVTEIPKHEQIEGLSASLTTWEYGDVAEILHIGPYNKEEPTIQKLKDFIDEQGYEIVGNFHEEVYFKGPTMYSNGNPEEYETFIRYRVKKKETVEKK